MAWSIAGKTVVITGATNGIGEAAAIALAKLGAHLILVGRDASRGAASLAKVRAAGDTQTGSAGLRAGGPSSGSPGPKLFLADLSSLAGVRALANQLKQLPRIDVLVNNAGAVFETRQVTVDGFERTFALNHLAYFLLTSLLSDKIVASAPARIIVVSSEAHRGGKLDFSDLQGERSFSGFRSYGTSKLCNLLFTRELARRLAGTGVTVNAMHPGTVATGFGRNNKGVIGVGIKLLSPFFRTPEKGAATIVYLAADPALEGVSGEYFFDLKRKTPTAAAQSDADAAKLWTVSEELTRVPAVQVPATPATPAL
jgi:NAD(P)-dependent dehydrogenase (short-subunit alcohol dehydrogenase family)